MTCGRIAAFTLFVLLAGAAPASAYIGPGAGFALMSSVVRAGHDGGRRRSSRSWRGRSARCIGPSCVPRATKSRDLTAHRRRPRRPGSRAHRPVHARRHPAELQRAGGEGSYRRLKTTFPVVSPVAWSSFSTGSHPARHNIFDFLDRDRRTYLPVLSSARVGKVERFLEIGTLSDSAANGPSCGCCASRNRSGRFSASIASGAPCCACPSRFRRIAFTAPN